MKRFETEESIMDKSELENLSLKERARRLKERKLKQMSRGQIINK